MLYQLKIKIKSLSAEVRMIRREEVKARNANRKFPFTRQEPRSNHALKRADLYEHRMGLRGKLRVAFLAYGFLRGRDFAKVESRPIGSTWEEEVLVRKVSHEASKFSAHEANALRDLVRAWLTAQSAAGKSETATVPTQGRDRTQSHAPLAN